MSMTGERIAVVEWLRFIACAAVVWAHCGTDILPGNAGVMVFTNLLVYFACHGEPSRTWADTARRSGRRLLVPWIFWSAVYAAARIVRNMVAHQPVLMGFRPGMFLAGTACQLWFLPFAFFLMLLVGTSWVGSLSSHSRGAVCWIGVAAVLLVLCERIRPLTTVVPLHQYMWAIPSAGFGLAFGATGRLGNPRKGWNLTLALVLLTAAVPAVLLPAPDYRYLGAVGVTTVVTGLSLRAERGATALERRVCNLTYGIYLVHPLVMSVLVRVLTEFNQTSLFISSMTGSTALVALLRRTPLRRVV